MIPIYLRNTPPPAETFDHIELLIWFAKWIKPERYLELGIRDGRCFTQIAPHCKQAIAVDIIDPSFSLTNNMEYKQMDTNQYFNDLKDNNIEFDMVFIDADHSHEQSYADFLNVKDMVIKDGFIFFHDSYPCSEELIASHFCNDCYKTPIKIKEMFSEEWETITLPFSPGVTICKKIYNKNGLPWM